MTGLNLNGAKLASLLVAKRERNPSFDIEDGYSILGTPQEECTVLTYLKLLRETDSHLLELGDVRVPILAIPLFASDFIVVDSSEDIVGREIDRFEVPVAYLHSSYEFLIEADEEYRKSIPLAGRANAIFRSWRSKEGTERNWEFNNTLFLWSPRYPPDIG